MSAENKTSQEPRDGQISAYSAQPAEMDGPDRGETETSPVDDNGGGVSEAHSSTDAGPDTPAHTQSPEAHSRGAEKTHHRRQFKAAPETDAEPRWIRSWAYPLNTFLMLAAGISLYSASDNSPVIAWLALLIGICAAIPFGVTVISSHNIFSAHLPRINKVALVALASLPVWQMNSFLLGEVEIPVVQHLVSLALLLALCCLVMVLDRRECDYDGRALTQHLALRAMDNASWVYSFSIGIVLALLTCLAIRVLWPDSVFDVKLLSRGLIPPVTLMLFYAGLTDLVLRFWSVFSQSQEEDSALNLLLRRLRRGRRETILDAIYTSMDRSGELNRYLVWAIPILGFIGTVLGISLAAQGMGSMLSSASQEYSEVLTEALEPLGIAFDTTLIALSLALVLALAQSLHNTWQDRRIGRLIDIYSQTSRQRGGGR